MEPMSLGSSSSSMSPTVNPNFLPSFLLGDPHGTTPGIPPSPVTPVVNRSLYKAQIDVSEPTNLRHKLFSTPKSVGSEVTAVKKVESERTGPPKQGLFDTIGKVKTCNASNTVGDYSGSPCPIAGDVSLTTSNFTSFNESRSMNRSIYNTSLRCEQLNSLWVTIFGFPPSSASLVLAEFSQCGIIVDKKFPTQGNWINLKYSSPNEVTKALSLNGKLIANCIMVGVLPYHNPQDSKENVEPFSCTSPVRARSLRHSVISLQNSNTVIPPQNVPQKSNGIVTKAMEYVFGW